MRRFRPKKRMVGVLFIGVILLLAYGILSVRQQPVPPSNPAILLLNAPQGTAPLVDNRGLPARLEIPTLKVDAAIAYMGLTEAGAMATPGNSMDVGWYKYGSLPGNIGSAVIAGHIDDLTGQPGVFSDLGSLQPGDTVLVTDGQGHVTSFTVRKTQTYAQNEQPTEVFNDAEGAHLNLITCVGDWDVAQHHFLQRLVVFTSKSD